MFKTTISIIAILIIIGVGYWVYQPGSITPASTPNSSDEDKVCLVDDDCVVFGKTGDCNCGCYNKNSFPAEIVEGCFCVAPTSCKCVNGKCEGIFVSTFNECVNEGGNVLESYPRQCEINETTFTEEYCTKEGASYIMTLETAKEIALKSECADYLEESYLCNENTGTYWIDLSLEKEGCSPACVVDIATEKAEINWRCTGLLIN
ncbi:MAG: hypothetical protein ABH800_01755 [Candidatus Nealsonbacteria bacterium]